jgi:tetratricopeptide (TPR) repeat protein
MVNEHRPYLPMAILSCAWLLPLLPLGLTRIEESPSARFLGMAGILVVSASLFSLTFQRNKVFSTDKAYYEDLVRKAPSARAYANYGLTFMAEKRYDEALRYYQQALQLAPNWHIVHVNLGLIYQTKGDDSAAHYHFDRGVETDLYSATARMYRGEYYLAKRRYAEALTDFQQILPLNREKYRIYRGLTTAASGLGNWRDAVEYCAKCLSIEKQQAERDMVSMSRPYWDRPDLCEPGQKFYQAINSLLPGRWWVHHNIADLASRCGMVNQAEEERSMARKLKAAMPAEK